MFTFVVGEVLAHGRDRQLLLEAIDLVEEENDRRFYEPPRVADGVEERQGLLHAVDRLVLKKQLVVLGNSNQEHNRRDILKAVNPLLTLGSLTTHIEHHVGQITNHKARLGNTRGLNTRPEYILVCRDVVRLGNPIDRIEVADNKEFVKDSPG